MRIGRASIPVASLVPFICLGAVATSGAAARANQNFADTVLGALAESPDIPAIDLNLLVDISEAPDLIDRMEARLSADTRERFNRAGVTLARPQPNRVIRERWRIAPDGHARCEEYAVVLQDGEEAESRLKTTTIAIPDSKSDPRPAYTITMQHESRLAILTPSRFGFRDWRALGSPAFVGRRLDPIRLMLGKPTDARPHADMNIESLRRAFRILSMETGREWQSGRRADVVRIGLSNGQPMAEFVVDSSDHRRCYELTAYDIDGSVKETVRTDRFEPLDGGHAYPRQAEITEFAEGREIRRSRISVTSVRLGPDVPSALFDLDAVVPSGWRVADHRVTPPKSYVKP
ncbi:MAG: hypothetical protein L6Q92_16130 [Phycisphaerae bacterium]|nr:hypothetical protein [Phycisphaerae bacterium]